MKSLVLSGGASKGAFTAGVAKYPLREKQMDFDMAVGNSTGSLVGGPALLGDYNYLADAYARFSNSDIFKNSLIGNVMNFLGIHNAPIDASMEPLHNLLKDYYFNNKKMEQLLDSGKYFAVALVNVFSGKVHFASTKHVLENKMKPETFVKAILASCCEPVFTQPIQVFEDEDSEFKDDLFYDGGVKEFIPFEHAVIVGASEIWAISTSPLTNTDTAWGRGTKPTQVNSLKALLWTVTAILDEVARGDRFRADNYFKIDKAKKDIEEKARGFGLTDDQIHKIMDAFKIVTPEGKSLPELRVIRPYEPMTTGLQFDPTIMLQYMANGELAAKRYFEEGAPVYTDATLVPWVHSVDYV